MKLLYISSFQFLIKDEVPYTIAAYGNRFWDQYSDVFEEIDVLGEFFHDSFDESQIQPITRKDVHVKLLPAMSRPSDYFNIIKVKPKLEEEIKKSDCILIKVISRKANLAIKLAKKHNKPYMIGMTGDVAGVLKSSKSIIRRIYGEILYRQSLRAIKDCKYGTYVTQEYLQKIYPIEGKMCGFTDAVLPSVDDVVLEKRLQKIHSMKDDSKIILGIIGSYHDNNKGYDTIIKALEIIKNENICLHILGVGVKEDQEKWISYASKHNVHNIVFDKPVSGVENVFKWMDQLDICLLPSRSEGLPRSIAEAITRACPCIVSNIAGLPELVEAKWLHDPEDYEKLASLIQKMLSDKCLMEDTAKNNFEHAKQYMPAHVKEKRDAFFTEFKMYAEGFKKNI